MRAVVYQKPGRANGRIMEVPTPEPGLREVRVKVLACAICKPAESSHDRDGSVLGVYPAVPGHEFAGVVDAIGCDVHSIRVGDRVTADNAYPCGVCHFCRNGVPTMCEQYRAQGHNLPGGFAEYVICREENLYRLPDELPMDHACLCELINCCESCVRHAELRYGESVVILGAGSSGQIGHPSICLYCCRYGSVVRQYASQELKSGAK